MFSNRKWVIITLADYTEDQLEDLVSNAIQSSSSTLRKSVDGTKAILKWDGDTPTIFNGMVTYNHTQILTTLATSEWTSEVE
tara:strand:+ start:1879 stop:2124 length:246 start_codon:yes stop_codon:yes gene_type:complete